MKPQRFEIDAQVLTVARALREHGGRALLVGGWVRDRLRDLDSKDLDVEVFGLSLDELEEVLLTFGDVIEVGRSFGVLKVKGTAWDFSIPRRESKVGRGHRGFRAELDPSLDFAAAARRRDLTINSIGWDPLTDELLDPHGGAQDLEQGVLRATDPSRFAEDSLRGLRVAQFLARFEMRPDDTLRALCAGLDLSDLPGERVEGELRKLLLQAQRPSAGFEFLRTTGLLRFLPELADLVGVEQDPQWHPEGTVWQHTLMVVDAAAGLRVGDEGRDVVLMYGALCHDLGKPATTVREGERVLSPGHEEVGVPITERFLGRLRLSRRAIDAVAGITRRHLAPVRFVCGGAGDRAYRRLARRLEEHGLDARLLHRAALADHLGRDTADARAPRWVEGERFLERMDALAVTEQAIPDVVRGRDLLARGLSPGPELGRLLGACREVQDETGWTSVEQILRRVLAEQGIEPPSTPGRE